MINELYDLAEAMEKAKIEESIPAQNFPPLAGGVCICVRTNEGVVTSFRDISQNEREFIHKYGVTSKGFYPCVKLAPLFRICEKEAISVISGIKRKPELLNIAIREQISSWCIESNNNWDQKVITRCKKALGVVSKELSVLLAESPYEPLTILTKETDRFDDPMCLHKALTEAALKAIALKEDVALALTVLFACPSKKSETKDSIGDLSFFFDAERLIECGMPPVTSRKFSEGLNAALLISEQQMAGHEAVSMTDAFHLPYSPTDTVMPEIKLAAGFSVKIRAMNKDVPCQHRYGKEGSYTYPASVISRQRLAKALKYISKEENRGVTWLTISYVDKKPQEVLFAYPLELKRAPQNFVRMFHRSENNGIAFVSKAKLLLSELKTPRCPSKDTHAKGIRIFVLRRINVDNNSGRTKVVYTRQTDPYELENRSEAWTLGCMNLPAFAFGQPDVPFPLDAADILNRFWKQNGESTDKFKPVPKYHGMELLMESDAPVTTDLHALSEKAMTIGAFLGNKLAKRDLYHHIWDKIKDLLALMGLLLYREGIGKDTYMESLPYLYGQLLKVSDELHALYCHAVRNGDFPTQLAGGGLYQAAVEAPIRTLNLLGQRMNPYIIWAKTYRTKKVYEEGKESWRAGWILSLYESIAAKLFYAWRPETRLNDEEKALLFIGYLSALPKKQQSPNKSEDTDIIEEVTDNE